jgi:hypothetical protein
VNIAAMTIKEFECLPEEVREACRTDCPYCGKELVGRLFCNPVHRERYRRRWKRNWGWLEFLAKEKAEPQAATERDLNVLGFEEFKLAEGWDVKSEPVRDGGTMVRRFG